jgi:predicted O-methyltransferase YrrM
MSVASSKPLVAASASERLSALVNDVPGWTPHDQLLALHFLAATTGDIPGDILEIGSWCGRSTVALAWGASVCGDDRVYSVDLFPEGDDWYVNADGTHSFRVVIDGREIPAYTDQRVWDEPFQRDIAPLYRNGGSIRERFQQALTDHGVAERVTTTRGDIGLFAEAAPPDFRCRLAFIDGDHGLQAVRRDVRAVERYLQIGGWIAFDDAFTGYDGVDQCITEDIINSGKYEPGYRCTRKMFIARRVA